MNYNRNYYSRRGRSFIPKPIDSGFTIDPSKVEAYKEYCLNNGLIKFPPPISPTIDGTMEVYNVHQSMTISAESTNQALLEDIVFNYTGNDLTYFDYVLCTISNINIAQTTDGSVYIANVTSGAVTGTSDPLISGLSGYLIYQSETGNTVFMVPDLVAQAADPDFRTSVAVESPGFNYKLKRSVLSPSTLDVVIETLIIGKLPVNQ